MARLRQMAPPLSSAAKESSSSMAKSTALKERTNITRSRPARRQKLEHYKDASLSVGATARRQRNGSVQDGLQTQTLDVSRTVTQGKRSKELDVEPQKTIKQRCRPPRMTRKPVQTAKSEALSTSGKISTVHQVIKPTTRASPAFQAQSPRRSNQKQPRMSQAHLELSLSPSPSVEEDLDIRTRKIRPSLGPPPSALKVHKTPSVESSILALKHFKRRPRQPSMLAMVQQRVASARPSLVGVQAHDDTSELELEDDVLDDFFPEAEGTPVHTSIRTSSRSLHLDQQQDVANASTPPTASHARKRKISALSDTPSATRSIEKHSQTRRRSSDAHSETGPIPSDTQERLCISIEASSLKPLPSGEVQVINSNPPSAAPSEHASPRSSRDSVDPDIVPSTERREDRSELEDATLAEPLDNTSRSSEPPTTQGGTYIMAEPLTQQSASPPRPRTRAKPKKKPLDSTALQSLLPKRRQNAQRQRKVTDYDIPSDSEGQEVETSYEEASEYRVTRNPRTRSRTASHNYGTPNVRLKKTTQRPPLESTSRTNRSAQKHVSAMKNATAKATRTYGGTHINDKENEEFEIPDGHEESNLVDDSTTKEVAAQTKELDAARKKFEEIDQWDMVFESMSAEDHRSSSQGWR